MWIIELLAHNEETNLNIKDYEGRVLTRNFFCFIS